MAPEDRDADQDRKPIPPARPASNAEEDFASMFAAEEKATAGQPRRRRASPGERVRGKISAIGRDTIFVELEGGNGEGMLDSVELRGDDGRVTAAVGDPIEATVVEGGGSGRALVLRRGLSRGPDALADLAQAFEHGIPVEGTITGANKGGVEVSVAGLRAFCPISQLDLRHVEDGAAFVGQKLTFRITRLEEDDRRGPNVVLSRRALLEEEARARAVETRAKLVVGAVLPGVVTALKDYGAFVDLGGIEGMLHVSEIGFQRVSRPADVLAVGQAISVQVIRIEKKNDPKRPEQVALSLKSMEADPWDEAARQLGEGSRVRGKVTRVTPFGAFIELAPGVEGLLHVSELGGNAGAGGGGTGGGGRPVRDARDAVKPDAELMVTVISVDRERRRISLGLSGGDEPLDSDARAAVDRASAPARLGSLGDLLKTKLAGGPKR